MEEKKNKIDLQIKKSEEEKNKYIPLTQDELVEIFLENFEGNL